MQNYNTMKILSVRFCSTRLNKRVPPSGSRGGASLLRGETRVQDGCKLWGRVQTRARVQNAATVKDVAYGQPRGALGRPCRRTAMPLLPRTVCGETAACSRPRAAGGDGWVTHTVRSGRGPRQGFLRDTVPRGRAEQALQLVAPKPALGAN